MKNAGALLLILLLAVTASAQIAPVLYIKNTVTAKPTLRAADIFLNHDILTHQQMNRPVAFDGDFGYLPVRYILSKTGHNATPVMGKGIILLPRAASAAEGRYYIGLVNEYRKRFAGTSSFVSFTIKSENGKKGIAGQIGNNSNDSVIMEDAYSELIVKDPAYGNSTCRYAVSVRRPLVHSASDIARGQRLTADILEWVWAEDDTDQLPLPDFDELTGGHYEAAKSIRQGRIISSNDIRKLRLVRTGEKINAVAKKGSITVVLDARAQRDGSLGDIIPIIYGPSRVRGEGRVTGEKKVYVNVE